MGFQYNPLAKFGFDEVGASGSTSACECKKVVPSAGEIFWDDDSHRLMNYVRFYEDNNTAEIPDFIIASLWQADWVGFDNVETVPDSAFIMSPYLFRGSFAKAKRVEVSAFKGTRFFYINKPGYSNEQGLVAPNIEVLASFAFAFNHNLIEAYFPKATTVYYSVFEDCTRLKELSLPECTIFEPTAIAGCRSLESLTLPKWTHCGVGENICFKGCSSLVSVSIPAMRLLPQWSHLFKDCNRLSHVDMRSQLIVPDFCFANKPYLNTVNIASATTIGTGAFWNVGYMGALDMPSVSKLEHFSIRDCMGLRTLNFGSNLSQFQYSNTVGSISNCPVLETVTVPNNWTIPQSGISFPGCPNITGTTVKSMGDKLANNTGNPVKQVGFDGNVKNTLALEGRDTSIFADKNYQLVFF